MYFSLSRAEITQCAELTIKHNGIEFSSRNRHVLLQRSEHTRLCCWSSGVIQTTCSIFYTGCPSVSTFTDWLIWPVSISLAYLLSYRKLDDKFEKYRWRMRVFTYLNSFYHVFHGWYRSSVKSMKATLNMRTKNPNANDKSGRLQTCSDQNKCYITDKLKLHVSLCCRFSVCLGWISVSLSSPGLGTVRVRKHRSLA